MLSKVYIWLIWSLIAAEFGLCSVLSSTEKIVGYYSDQSAYKNPLLPYRYVNYSSGDQSYLILNAQAPNDGYVYEYDVSIVQNGPVQLGVCFLLLLFSILFKFMIYIYDISLSLSQVHSL